MQRRLFLFNQAGQVIAVPKAWQQDIALLQKKLYLRKARVSIGAAKANLLYPITNWL